MSTQLVSGVGNIFDFNQIESSFPISETSFRKLYFPYDFIHQIIHLPSKFRIRQVKKIHGSTSIGMTKCAIFVYLLIKRKREKEVRCRRAVNVYMLYSSVTNMAFVRAVYIAG